MCSYRSRYGWPGSPASSVRLAGVSSASGFELASVVVRVMRIPLPAAQLGGWPTAILHESYKLISETLVILFIYLLNSSTTDSASIVELSKGSVRHCRPPDAHTFETAMVLDGRIPATEPGRRQ